MKKRPNFQLSQSNWVPTVFKKMINEFLDYIVLLVKANKPFLPAIANTETKGKEFYLFAPEVGGSSPLLIPDLLEAFPDSSITVLSDNLSSQRKEHLQNLLLHDIHFAKMSDLPEKSARSERILISINRAHLESDTELSRQIDDMSSKFDQIIIGEGNNKSVRQVIGMLILAPLVSAVCGPKIKPFRASRLVFTYMIPLLPLMIAWDGIVALFLIRSPEKVLDLANRLNQKDWHWRSGKMQNNRGGFVIYLQGRRVS